MQARIIVGIVIIVGLVGYLAFVGFEEGRSYYVTCDQVAAAEADFRDTNLKLAGIVVDGSITRDGDILTFKLEYDGATYPVRYIGMDPVPDTFKDGVEAAEDDGWQGLEGLDPAELVDAGLAEEERPGQRGET